MEMIIERETKGLLFLGILGADDHGGFLSLQYSVDYQRQLATDLKFVSFVT